MDIDQIEEVDGVLLISKTSVFLRYMRVEVATVQHYIDAIETDQPFDLDPTLAFVILLALRQDETDLSPKLMDRFLSNDAAVLRAAAIEKWLQFDRAGDEDIVRRIKNDTTPSVSIAVLAALTRSWEDVSEDRREVVLSILETHAEAPGSAIILMEHLSMFNRAEQFGETPPWQVFSRIATVAFENAPDVVFRNGRITSVVEAAIGAGEGERLIPFLTAWAKQLTDRIVSRLPDEFELSIPDSMIDVGSPSWRWPLIEGILNVHNTGARLRTIATLTSRWNDLSSGEQRAVLEILSQDGSDTNWLRAAALTRTEVPGDLVTVLGGSADLLSLAPPELLSELGEPLFCACLYVYIGAPQPLWWLGSHHAQGTIWAEAVRWSAKAPNRPCFQRALDDQLSFADDDGWLSELVNQYNVAELPAVSEVFLSRKIGDNGNWRTAAWNSLLDRGDEAGLIDEWFEKILDAAPAFLDHLRDVSHWLGEGPHADRLIAGLATDFQAYKLTNKVSKLVEHLGQIDGEETGDPADERTGIGRPKEQLILALLQVVERTLANEPPQLFGTWDDIAKLLKSLGFVASPMLEWIEKQRLLVLEDRRGTHQFEIDTEDQSVLLGWVGPR